MFTDLPFYTLGVVVGLVLSDARLEINIGCVNPRLCFKQLLIHFPYFWFVFTQLSHFIQGKPYYYIIRNSKRYKILTHSLYFWDRSLIDPLVRLI